MPGSLELYESSIYLVDCVLFLSGYNGDVAARYSTQSQLANANTRSQFPSTSYMPHDQLASNQAPSSRHDNRVGLALGPPLSAGFQPTGSSMTPGLNPFDDWSSNRDKGDIEFLTEEEIRMRSHEMLENEDMQHLLRLFSMGGHASITVPEDGYGFPTYMPSPQPFDEDRSRSGKAVVGWLKIKAAMRWGFFIRKKAAERRAQIVELDE